MTKPNFDGYTTDAVADFINRSAPIVADLPEDHDAHAAMLEEVEAAIDEFRSRHGLTTVADGGVDNPFAHLEDEEWVSKGMHKGEERTRVVDGEVVHEVELTGRPAYGATSLKKRPARECPRHEDTDAERTEETDVEARDGKAIKTTFECPEDGCPFRVEYLESDWGDAAPTGYGDNDAIRMHATIPHVDPDDRLDDADLIVDDDGDKRWDVYRSLETMHFRGALNDTDYYADESYDADDREYYLHTVECGKCGREVRESRAESHAHFGDVCPDHADATVWSLEDADLPDDVVDALDDYKSITPSKIVALLKDVAYRPHYKAANVDDKEPDDFVTKTGKQGKRDAHAMGRGRKGTGMRRPDGAFHGFRHWRTLLRVAVDTGLIKRADDTDADDDDPGAAWEATDKGLRVFEEMARCATCGGRKFPYKHTSTYTTGKGYGRKSTSLTLACPACDAMSSSPGAGVIASSTGGHKNAELPGINYEAK